MSEIGRFYPTMDRDPLFELSGAIRTIKVELKLYITRGPTPQNSRAPTHTAYALSEDGKRTAIGSAWTQRIKQGTRSGEEFLSVSIDDPSFPDPLSFSLFQDGEIEWVATWRRRKASA